MVRCWLFLLLLVVSLSGCSSPEPTEHLDAVEEPETFLFRVRNVSDEPLRARASLEGPHDAGWEEETLLWPDESWSRSLPMADAGTYRASVRVGHVTGGGAGWAMTLEREDCSQRIVFLDVAAYLDTGLGGTAWDADPRLRC